MNILYYYNILLSVKAFFQDSLVYFNVDEDIGDNWSDEDDGYDDLLLAASRMVEGVTDVVNEVAEGEVDVSSSYELPGLHTPWGSVRNFLLKFSCSLKVLFYF